MADLKQNNKLDDEFHDRVVTPQHSHKLRLPSTGLTSTCVSRYTRNSGVGYAWARGVLRP